MNKKNTFVFFITQVASLLLIISGEGFETTLVILAGWSVMTSVGTSAGIIKFLRPVPFQHLGLVNQPDVKGGTVLPRTNQSGFMKGHTPLTT
jgi:hypothetical protein